MRRSNAVLLRKPTAPAASPRVALPPAAAVPALLKNYPGSKAGAGVWLKKPAARTILVDADGAICRHLAEEFQAGRFGSALVVEGDGTRLAGTIQASDAEKVLAYVDPPYLFSTRKGRGYYRHEFGSDRDHRRLLAVLDGSPHYVMLSGYPSPLYTSLLDPRKWRCLSYLARTRGSTREECLWLNFPAGLAPHDTRFAGEGFRERERIKRKARRWVRMLLDMTVSERAAVLDLIDEEVLHRRG